MSEGAYIGVVFSDAEGESLDCDQMNDSQIEAWGKSLGSLHVRSQEYEPPKEIKRKDWRDGLDHIAVVLDRQPHEKEAMMELDNLRIWLYSLKQSKHEYGLIHYDFQQDNIFWHASTSQFHVIGLMMLCIIGMRWILLQLLLTCWIIQRGIPAVR